MSWKTFIDLRSVSLSPHERDIVDSAYLEMVPVSPSTRDNTLVTVAAFANAALVGGAVFLRPGTHIWNNAIPPPDGAKLVAIPGTVTITRDATSTNAFLTLESIDDILIDGVVFDGNRRNGATGVSVQADTVDNLSIKNCKFFDGTNLRLAQAVTNARITNNVISGGSNGIAIGTGTTPTQSSDIIIQGNYFEDIESEAIDVNENVVRCVINGNVLFNNHTTAASESEAIDIGGGTQSDIIVSNNIIDCNSKSESAIQIKSSADRVKILGNICLNGKADGNIGIRVNGVTNVEVANNHTDGFKRGIGGGNTSSDINIHDNTVENPETDGINISVGTNARIKINHNTLIAGSATEGGIDIDNTTTDFEVDNNIVSGFAADGINIQSGCSRGSVSGNQVDTCDDGIFVLAAQTIVSGNICRANGKTGISIQADHCTVTGNQTYDNDVDAGSTYGITVQTGSDFCVFQGNKSYDSRAGGSRTQFGGLRITGACDRCIVQENILYNNTTTNILGTGNLTNSVYVAADNIIA